MASSDIYGKGWAYPLRFTSGGGVAKQGSDTLEQVIRMVSDSIRMIIGTYIQTRSYLRAFGSRAIELIFEPNDVALQGIFTHYVIEAILFWEKRVRDIRVDFVTSEEDRQAGRFVVNITFFLIREQVEGNVVIPFALEGNRLKVVGLTPVAADA